MTDLINSIDSWPKAIVALACIAAIAWVLVKYIKALFG